MKQMKLTATMPPLRTRQRKRFYRIEVEKSPVARSGFCFWRMVRSSLRGAIATKQSSLACGPGLLRLRSQ
jgi:hypothetical protein